MSYPLPGIQALAAALGVGAVGGSVFDGWEFMPEAWKEELWVSPGGFATNNGRDKDHPLLTIQSAIDLASTTKFTRIHLVPYLSSANTIADFDDDAVAAASVASGNERLINAWVYIYKSNIQFIGHGVFGNTKVIPAAAASAGIVAIKTGMSNISFKNIDFDATTAAAGHIVTVGTVDTLVLDNCRFNLGTVQLDLDAGLATDCIIKNCTLINMDTDGIAIAGVRGGIYNTKIGIDTYLAAGGKITSGITLTNTSGSIGFTIDGVVIHGGDDGGTNDVITKGIFVGGTNVVGATIINYQASECDQPLDDDGTDTFRGGSNVTPDGEPNSIASGSADTVGQILMKSS